ncbi:MAG: 4-hydroxy-tetrahydrodipicolinate reductase [Paludibacter sp.]|jgi:4-hydroxy-tetrahydrodipicolinate reductase|nr:4-hydroxy-tetrahydrodipicolinate reductase [Paludibacter sp.]
MNIALIGYGKMGKTIEKIARERGHQIVAIIDVDNSSDFDSPQFRSADVAIEFTAPAVALRNIKSAFAQKIPVVCGTTGWTDALPDLKREITENGNTLFWSSNYSIGVNIFMAVNKYLARLMNDFPSYNVEMTEIHHIHKLDSPSGTAITLAEQIIQNIDRKTSWVEGNETSPEQLSIHPLRQGEVPGIHQISYNSQVDTIEISHSANSREGFALGAVIAAEFIKNKSGFFSMEDLMRIEN